MSRKQLMIRGAVLSALSVGVSMSAMLLVGKLVTVSMYADAVAVYALIRLAGDFLTLLVNFGVAVSLPKIVGAAEAVDRKGILGSVVRGQVMVSAALFAAVLVFWRAAPDGVEWFAHPGWQSVWPYMWLAALLMAVGSVRDTALAGLAGLNAYSARAAGIVFIGAAQVVLVGGAVWLHPDSVKYVCLALVGAYGTGVLFMLPASGIFQRNYAAGGFLHAARYSVPLYLNSLVTFFALRFDTVLIGLLLGRQYFGIIAIYEMTKYVPMVLSRGLGALLLPFLPNFSEFTARSEREKATELLGHALRMTSFAGYMAMFCAVLVQEPLLRLLFTEEYERAAPVLGLLLTGIVLAVQAGLMGQALIALDRTWRVTLANTLIAGLSIALNVQLILQMGIMGAGWAMIGAFAFGYMLQYGWVRGAGIIVPWRAMVLPQMCLALAAVPLFWQPDAFWARAAAMLLFAALSFATGVIRMGDVRDWLRAFGKS